jgi:hypothetical protein
MAIIGKKKRTLRERAKEVDQKLALSEGRRRDLNQKYRGPDPRTGECFGNLSSRTSAQNGGTISTNYQITPVLNGQYEVTIDLSKWLPQYELLSFIQAFQRIGPEDKYFSDICSLNGSVLKYKSESLFPDKYDQQKKKVMIVLGNPATHSVAGGMFFYSRSNEDRHQFWGKLEEADLMPEIRHDTREEEANVRKKLILDGETSDKYLLGLTTFYSFPTPVNGDYKDVSGVEALFRPVISRVQRMELDRLLSYEFSQDTLLVFTQKSSYNYAVSSRRVKRLIYWPLRGAGSSGMDLVDLLNLKNNSI